MFRRHVPTLDTVRRTAIEHQRRIDRVTGFAVKFTTDRENPDAVLANAQPLVAWLTVAPVGSADHDARYRALHRADHARSLVRAPDDDVEAFLDEACAYYDFYTRNGEPSTTTAPYQA